MTIAQTSVELFKQLEAQNLSAADLQRVRKAYGYAMALFAGRMHPSGRPYLCHCIGAASTLASVDAPIDVIVATLLHAAYRLGDFGWRSWLAAKRHWVERAVGAAAEAYILGFEQLPWNSDAVAVLRDRCDTLDATTRTVVLMRFASELDNLHDRGPLLCADGEARREGLRVRGPLLLELADRLRVPPAFRDALADAAADVSCAEVDASLRWPSTAVTLPPASTRRRWAARAVTTARAVAHRL